MIWKRSIYGLAATLLLGSTFTLQAQSVVEQQVAPAQPSVYGNLARVRSTRQATPRLILSQPMDESAQRELTEDLQVMDGLLTRAIVGDSLPPGAYTRVLGVLVNSRDDSHSRIQYIQGVGLIFRYQVGVSLAADGNSGGDKKDNGNDESDWDSVRRELFAPSSTYSSRTSVGRTASITYDESRISAMKGRVLTALKNIGRIRHLSTPGALGTALGESIDPYVIVVIDCAQDGSVMSFATTAGSVAGGDDSAVETFQYRHSNWRQPETAPLYPGYFREVPVPEYPGGSPVVPNPGAATFNEAPAADPVAPAPSGRGLFQPAPAPPGASRSSR